MADPEMPQKPKRIWKFVFALSLALNLAVVGIVAGAVISGRVGDGPPRNIELGLGPMIRSLAPQERRDILRDLRQARVLRDLDPRGRVEGIVTTLKAEPFDEAALRAILSEQAARVGNLQATAQDAFVAVVLEMTPERRATFADQLREESAKERPRPTRPASGG